MTYTLSQGQKEGLSQLLKLEEPVSSFFELLENQLSEHCLDLPAPEDSSPTAKNLVKDRIKLLAEISKDIQKLTKKMNRLDEDMNCRLSHIISPELSKISSASESDKCVRWKAVVPTTLLELIDFAINQTHQDWKQAYSDSPHLKTYCELVDFWTQTLNKEIGSMSNDAPFVNFISIILLKDPDAVRHYITRHRDKLL